MKMKRRRSDQSCSQVLGDDGFTCDKHRPFFRIRFSAPWQQQKLQARRRGKGTRCPFYFLLPLSSSTSPTNYSSLYPQPATNPVALLLSIHAFAATATQTLFRAPSLFFQTSPYRTFRPCLTEAEATAAVAQQEAAAAATRTGTIAEAVDTAGPPTTITQANMLRMGMRSHSLGTGISSTVTGSPFIYISLLNGFCAQDEYSGYGRRLCL